MNTKKFSGRPRTSKPESYHHLKNVEIEYDNGRVATHVTAIMREGDDGKMYAAFSECSSRDQFCYRTGRSIARRKWFNGDRVEIPSRKFEDVFSAGGYSAWVKPAAVAGDIFCADCA